MTTPCVLAVGRGWLVCEKPEGLLSVPGKGPDKADCLFSRLQKDFPGILTVHRLDQATSGLMVWALDKHAQREISRQFEQRRVHKEYEALIGGIPPESEGLIVLKQRLDVDNRPLQIRDEEQGKLSVTRWTLKEKMEGDIARVRLFPETGRTHQLRLHMAELGFPILGDPLYGGREYGRTALHACRLDFEDPYAEGERVIFESAVPF